MVKRPGSLCHRAFVGDLGLALGGSVDCWSSKVLVFLADVGISPPAGIHGDDLIAHYATLKLPVGSIMGKFAKRLDERWRCPNTLGDPRAFPSGTSGVKLCRYSNWMGRPPLKGVIPAWLAHAEAVLPKR